MKQKNGENDFLAVGSAVVDVHAIMKDVDRIDIRAPDVKRFVCISFASKTELDNLKISVGGSAMNSTVTMSRLGARTALLSAVGTDEFGKRILKEIGKSGINSEFLKRKKGSSGIGIDLVSQGGEKSVLVYRGVLNKLSPKDLPEEAVKKSSHIFITSLVSNSAYNLFLKLLKLAKKYRKPIVFAPSISMLHAFKDRLSSIHDSFDLVIINYEEASYYTGKGGVKEMLRALPGKVCVITKDADGAYARKGRKYYHIPAAPIKVQATVGAGDAFNGAFAYDYYRTGSLKEALKLATSVAGMKLAHVEAIFHPSVKEVERFRKKYGRYLKVKEV